MTGSLSYSFIQTSIKRALLNAKATNATSMFTVMTMSMERFYSSVALPKTQRGTLPSRCIIFVQRRRGAVASTPRQV